MRHYEILLMIHPDQSSQINAMIERYTAMIIKVGGKIHRQEDWGKLQLAYQINKIHKANYVLLNVECTPTTIAELHNAFKFNDVIIRTLITNCEHAITEQSAFLRNKENEKNNKDNNNFNGSASYYNNSRDYDSVNDSVTEETPAASSASDNDMVK